MKNKEIGTLLKETRQKYSRLKKVFSASLRKFSKNDEELNVFLFQTLLGVALRDKMVRHIFDKSLLKQTQHESKKLPLRCNSVKESIRIFKLLNVSKLHKYLKSEFSISLDVYREEGSQVIVGFKE